MRFMGALVKGSTSPDPCGLLREPETSARASTTGWADDTGSSTPTRVRSARLGRSERCPPGAVIMAPLN
jgi:hypothetical protein